LDDPVQDRDYWRVAVNAAFDLLVPYMELVTILLQFTRELGTLSLY
jgi:hypothetical protein